MGTSSGTRDGVSASTIATASRSPDGSRVAWLARGVCSRAAFPRAARSAAVWWITLGEDFAATASLPPPLVLGVSVSSVSIVIGLLLHRGWLFRPIGQAPIDVFSLHP